MSVSLLSIGKRMPVWVNEACNDYQKRLPKQWQFQIQELAQSRADTAELRMAAEAKTLLSAVPDKAHLVALDNRGKTLSTQKLSAQLQKWLELGKPIQFLIGGPDGLHNDCRDRSDELISLSELTYPHPLVRVIWLEQLYRAQSILNNHPYHRDG